MDLVAFKGPETMFVADAITFLFLCIGRTDESEIPSLICKVSMVDLVRL